MIEVNTVLDKAALTKLNIFHMFRKNFIFIPICMILFLAFGIMSFLFPEEESDKYFGIIFAVVFGLGFPALSYFIMKLLVWLQVRSAKFVSSESLTEYKFDENNINCRMQRPGMITTTESVWDLCYRAYETKDCFFIYISNMQAHIIPKKDFTAGTPAELAEILHNKVKKFKQYT